VLPSKEGSGRGSYLFYRKRVLGETELDPLAFGDSILTGRFIG